MKQRLIRWVLLSLVVMTTPTFAPPVAGHAPNRAQAFRTASSDDSMGVLLRAAGTSWGRGLAFLGATRGTAAGDERVLPESRAGVPARGLTFEQRVEVQEAIERVYYAHQIGATKPFEEAVPRSLLESKVRRYLKQTAALERFWKTPVTDAMLARELERMAAGTRLPERLAELYAALGNDPFLIKECLARQVLVDRLSRNFFAFDETIHAEAHEQALEIHRQLVDGELDPSQDHPARTVVELAVREPGEQAAEAQHDLRRPARVNEPARLELSADEFRKHRARWPAALGEISNVEQERDAYVIRVVLEETPERARAAAYRVPKVTWDAWWQEVEGGLEEDRIEPVAQDGDVVPAPVIRPGPGSESGSGLTDGGQYAGATAAASCSGDNTWDNGTLDDPSYRRSGYSAVWTGSLMVVWGGLDGNKYLSTGARYDPATDTWTPTSTTNAPIGRQDHTAVWTGSLMLVWGGIQGGLTYLGDGGRYDPATDTWTQTSSTNAPSPRSHHTAVWTGSLMVVWGGNRGGSLNTGGRYDPAMDSWAPTSTLNTPSARWGHTAVWTGSIMLIWGGTGDLNTGGRYDPATDTWTPTSTTNAPIGRQDHTAVWTDSLMVVWGGLDGTSYLGTGGRYDPATDTWTQTSSTNAPSPRSHHTAVWTGSLMVVWGGSEHGNVFNSGARYDPATDTWTQTSSTNAPSPRSYHTAVWTGSLMVVWGGTDGRVLLSTGGRYEPATDTWTPTSGTNAPIGRQDHTVVWTGSLMVVWGGRDGTSTFGTGGRYDPATDTWTPTSTINTPTARYGHTAVWTGSLMVVWGGIYGTSTLGTGGRYDPATDIWMPISTTNAPAARYLHTVVWTGSLMVVWGGTGGGYLNTGGRYDPATDTWTQTSSTNAPSPRYLHTAVWTGGLMLVWGGYDGAYLDTGGRLIIEDPLDRDADGYPVCAGDCDDTRASVYPGAAQVCDGLNNDCSHLAWPALAGTNEADNDGDSVSTCAGDCDDTRASVYPGAPRICDGLNNDCNDPSWPAAPADDSDADADGWRICTGDCNDADAGAHPGAVEICNGRDDDCDGIADETCDAACDFPAKVATETDLTPAGTGASGPKLIWTGSAYGAVWSESTAGNYDIHFALYDTNLNLISSSLFVPGTGVSPTPGLTWTGSEFGVVWSDTRDADQEIYFNRLNASGNTMGNDVRITDAAGSSRLPRIAWSGTDYGVVWNDARSGSYEGYFARVDASGAVVPGSERRITAVTVPESESQGSRLIWNGSVYGIVYNDVRDGDWEIYFQTLDRYGATVTPETRLTSAAGVSRVPSIAWDGAAGQFGISWVDNRFGTDWLFFMRVAPDGTKLTDDIPEARINAPGANNNAVVHSGGEFALAWQDAWSGNAEIYFARLANDVLNGSAVPITSDPATSQAPSLVWNGSEYVVAFQDDLSGTNHGYAARIGCCTASTVGDRAWNDLDRDGVQDPGEPGAPGVVVAAYDASGGLRGFALTSSTGSYTVGGLSCGTSYELIFFPPYGEYLSPRDQGSDDALDSDPGPATGSTGMFVLGGEWDATRWDAGIEMCAAPDEPIYIYMVTLSTDGNKYPILHFMDANQTEQVTGYNVYRAAVPSLPPASWTLMASDVIDMDEATPNNQWVDSSGDPPPGSIWYYSVTAFNHRCPAEGPW